MNVESIIFCYKVNLQYPFLPTQKPFNAMQYIVYKTILDVAYRKVITM